MWVSHTRTPGVTHGLFDSMVWTMCGFWLRSIVRFRPTSGSPTAWVCNQSQSRALSSRREVKAALMSAEGP